MLPAPYEWLSLRLRFADQQRRQSLGIDSVAEIVWMIDPVAGQVPEFRI